MSSSRIIEYLKSQSWFFGVRAEATLLFYSASAEGKAKYVGREYGRAFAETLLVPVKKGKPIRVFNLQQAKKFHTVSEAKILKNPHILASYIKKDDDTYRKIETYGKKLAVATKKENCEESVKIFRYLIDLYERASANFITIFSLGLKLTEHANALKDAEDVTHAHDVWRNSIAFKEEALGKNLFYFFKFLTKKKKLSCTPFSLMKFLTLREITAWLEEKITNRKIQDIVAKRSKNGFVYLHLRNEETEVIDDSKDIAEVRRYFTGLEKKSNEPDSGKQIFGQVAYRVPGKIIGEVIVIKDKSKLRSRSHLIDGKILVAVQTTPHFIPYIKNAKAIITDEGGITCHAAIVAREFKIPCIVGTKVGTQMLKDGAVIEIDTMKGTARIR